MCVNACVCVSVEGYNVTGLDVSRRVGSDLDWPSCVFSLFMPVSPYVHKTSLPRIKGRHSSPVCGSFSSSASASGWTGWHVRCEVLLVDNADLEKKKKNLLLWSSTQGMPWQESQMTQWPHYTLRGPRVRTLTSQRHLGNKSRTHSTWD